MLNLLVAVDVMTFCPSDKIAIWYHIVLTAFKGIDVNSPTTIILTNSSGATASESKSSVLVNIVMGRVYTLWIENHKMLSMNTGKDLYFRIVHHCGYGTSLSCVWHNNNNNFIVIVDVVLAVAVVAVVIVAVVVIVCEG